MQKLIEARNKLKEYESIKEYSEAFRLGLINHTTTIRDILEDLHIFIE